MPQITLLGAIRGESPSIYAFTAIGATMPKEYTIGGQNSCIYVVTLSEAETGLETYYTGAVSHIGSNT